jgi:tetratricopeptide (TPR) repeat protein
MSRTQATEPLNLESKPLPPDPLAKAGEPENGLVGKYALAAELSATRVTVDMPLRLRLTLRGEGNIRVAPAPRLTAGGEARLQLEDRSERVERVQDSIRGELTYHYLLVPVQPGALNLGSALIRYFEPEAGVWRSAEAALPRVQVLPKPALQEAGPVLIAGERRTPHLRPNHGGQARLRTSDRPVAARIDFWALQAVGVLVLALVLAGRRWQRRRLSDPVVARALRAFPLARRSLRAAAHHIRRRVVSKFYDAMARTTAEYLAAKFGIATAYIVTERLPELFQRFAVPGVFGTRFRVTLTACEYVRFAAVELPEHDMRSLYRDLSRAIAGFEHHWRKRGAVKKAAASGAAVLLLLLAGAGAARAGDAELYFLRGNTYAEQNQQAQALAEYQRIVGMGVSDPDVFYNLGNTYLRLGQIGRAMLAYERGRRLAPRDPDLRANLATAASLAVDAQPEEDLGAHPVQSVYRWFTGDELAWAASACYLAALAALILALLWPRAGRVFRRAAVMLGVCALLATGWCAARATEPYWWKRAVIMTPTAEVRGRPYSESETLYTLHEGTRVTLEREEEEWVEVRFSQGRHGWIMRAALGIIE